MIKDTTEETTTKKRSILNILGIIGFIAAVLLVAWLSFLFVRSMPSMFTSLASLSEGLRKPAGDVKEIVLESSTETTKSGETVDITWDEQEAAGSYTFSYGCIEGVSIEIMSEQGAQPARCDTIYNIGNVTNTKIRVSSDKSETVTVPYTVAFIKMNETSVASEATSTLAIAAIDSRPKPQPRPETIVEEVKEPAVAVTVPAVRNNTPTSVPVEPRYTYQSYIPVSNPNGYSDLAVRFLEMGEVNGTRFTAKNTLSQNDENFYRFEIKNVGTRTSDTFDYTVKLPDGTKHERTGRTALKPNERAVITIRFSLDERDRNGRFTVTTETDRDTVNTNNSLTQLASIR